MTAAETYFRFWGQFGIPVSEEGAVLNAAPPGYPCLVCRYGEGTGGGDAVELTASLWVRSSGWRQARELSERIGEALPVGGVYLPADGGGIWLLRGRPWAVWSGDGEDPSLRRVLFRVTVRHYGGGTA